MNSFLRVTIPVALFAASDLSAPRCPGNRTADEPNPSKRSFRSIARWDDQLLVTTEDGLFRTKWERVDVPQAMMPSETYRRSRIGLGTLVRDPLQENVVYLVNETGLWKSGDAGVGWTQTS